MTSRPDPASPPNTQTKIKHEMPPHVMLTVDELNALNDQLAKLSRLVDQALGISPAGAPTGAPGTTGGTVTVDRAKLQDMKAAIEQITAMLRTKK